MPETPLENIKRYEDRLKNVNSKIGLAYATLLGATLVFLLLILTDYYDGSSLLAWVSVIGGAVIGAIVRIFKKNPSKMWLAYYYAYFHILAAIFFFVVTPAEHSPPMYIIYWIILSTVTYLDIGRKVFIASVLSLGVLLVLDVTFSSVRHPLDRIGEIAVFYIFLLYIVFYIYLITSIARDEAESISKISLRVEFERRKLEVLINSMEESVLLCDSELKITMCNKSTGSLLHTNEIIGLNIDDVLHLWDKKGKPRTIAEHCNDQTTELQSINEYMHYFSPKDRISLSVFTKVVKLPGTNNRDRNYMIVLRDITKQKSLEDERDEFVAIMSHELRTPVSIVEGGLNLAQLYLVKKEYEKLGDFLGKAQDSTATLADIVNGLSSLVQNEKYGDTIEVRETDPEQLVDKLYRASLQESKERGLDLKVFVDENIKPVETNAEYLYEIVHNLMSNALKYTRNGYVELRAVATKGDSIEISVHDTGIGMSTGDSSHIFEKFWRSEDYRTRESGGTGIGLYIAKKLADSLGVTITVKSEIDKGSTFSIIVPTKFRTHEPEAEK